MMDAGDAAPVGRAEGASWANSQAKGLYPDGPLESVAHRRGTIFQVNGQGTRTGEFACLF